MEDLFELRVCTGNARLVGGIKEVHVTKLTVSRTKEHQLCTQLSQLLGTRSDSSFPWQMHSPPPPLGRDLQLYEAKVGAVATDQLLCLWLTP